MDVKESAFTSFEPPWVSTVKTGPVVSQISLWESLVVPGSRKTSNYLVTSVVSI